MVVTLPKTTKDVGEMLSSGCMYKHLQELLLKAACGKDYVSKLQFVTTFYGEDINSSVLQVQLELFNTYLNSKEFNNDGSFTILQIRDCFCKLSPAARASMSEVATVLKLLMVMPATNAVSERTASALRRIKTYLRSTCSQKRLNHLMTLHIHKDHTDNLPLKCLNEFVDNNAHRLTIFGKFTD